MREGAFRRCRVLRVGGILTAGGRLAAIRHAAAGRPPTTRKGTMSVLVAIGERNAAYAAALMTFIGDEPGLECAGPVDRVDRLVDLIIKTGAGAAVIGGHLAGGGVEAVADPLQCRRHPCRMVVVASVRTTSLRRAANRAGAVLVERGDGPRLLEALTVVEH